MMQNSDQANPPLRNLKVRVTIDLSSKLHQLQFLGKIEISEFVQSAIEEKLARMATMADPENDNIRIIVRAEVAKVLEEIFEKS